MRQDPGRRAECAAARVRRLFQRQNVGQHRARMTPASTVIPFVKASTCGNDFLIIDGMHAPADMASFSQRICDRHAGVGADGVEWLFPAQDADLRARLFNADGSEAEISGNGTRCVAAYLCSEQPREKVTIRTGRSEEHTSELQSRFDLVCRLLLEKKKITKKKKKKR